MRIALITDGIWPYVMGGMQKHSYYLCKYLAQQGVEIDLYHVNRQQTYDIHQLEFFTRVEKENINSFVVPLVQPRDTLPGHYLRTSKKQSAAILDLFQTNNQDVDLIYTKGLAGWQFMEAKQRGVKLPPITIKVHGYEMYQKAPSLKVKLQHLMLRPTFRYLNRNADYIFSYGGKITDIITQRLQEPLDKVIEIPTGIGEDWLPESDESKVNHPRKFIFLGRYERRKGVEELTSVLKELSKTQVFSFEFIGPIPNANKIESDKVRYHGSIYDKTRIQQILRQADVLVVPSYAEGMPNVILEGMASGCAIIASDVGAVCEQVSESNGWLIAPGNKQQLQEALIQAINVDEDELRVKKQASLEKVKESFLWSSIIEAHIHAFQRVIEKISYDKS